MKEFRKTLSIAAAAVLASLCAGAAQAADPGDPAKGEKVFRKCQACHAVGPEAKAKVGPVLNGIIGHTAGTQDGFKYSKAMLKAAAEEQLVWTPENLDAFLKKPKAFLPGTKMTFAGLRKEKDRQNLIAYLASFEAD